jgi:hypothetical protein
MIVPSETLPFMILSRTPKGPGILDFQTLPLSAAAVCKWAAGSHVDKVNSLGTHLASKFSSNELGVDSLFTPYTLGKYAVDDD